MPHLDNDRGTFVLDVRVPGVGRIKRASGTSDKKTYKRLREMLDTLQARGRLDLLVALREGVITPLQLWDAYRSEDLDRLPTAETIAPLWTPNATGAVDRWLAAWSKSEHHLRATTSSFAQLRKLAPDGKARVGDLPALLKKYRAACERAETGVSFNRARSHVQAFLRDTLGRGHRLWRQSADLQLLSTDRREGRPLSVAALDALCAKLAEVAPAHAAIARGMAGAGMGPGEFWGRWAVQGAGETLCVRIHGTKREGRDRTVPYVWPLERPDRHPRTFLDTLATVSGGAVQPYDLRRTFAHWCEEAGIPRTRRKLYLGHAAGDVTDLYERHEIDAYLARDGELLRAYVARQRAAAATPGATAGQGATESPTTSNTTGPEIGARVDVH
jgi:integrase